MYVAARRIKVGDGYREPGDPVPEAAGWPNLKAHLNCNMIKEVPDRAPALAVDKPVVVVTAASSPPPAAKLSPLAPERSGRRR